MVGYRLISSSELADILATPANVYDFDFFRDKTFGDFKIKNFQAEFYNSGDIMSIDLSIATTFEQELVGESWEKLPRDELFEVNLNY